MESGTTLKCCTFSYQPCGGAGGVLGGSRLRFQNWAVWLHLTPGMKGTLGHTTSRGTRPQQTSRQDGALGLSQEILGLGEAVPSKE